MTRTSKTNLVVFRENDVPNFASHCPQSECGFSIYRGILVQWDEDQDERVLSMIDEMPEFVRNQLLVVQEHEAILGFIWKGHVPAGYEKDRSIDIDGDIWNIHESVGN